MLAIKKRTLSRLGRGCLSIKCPQKKKPVNHMIENIVPKIPAAKLEIWAISTCT